VNKRFIELVQQKKKQNKNNNNTNKNIKYKIVIKIINYKEIDACILITRAV
jgi:hypothetical protein